MDIAYWMGIDPGASGGVAIVGTDGFAEAWPLDGTEADTSALIREVGPKATFTLIEAVHAFPQQGVSSTFAFGRAYGFLRGLLVAHQVPFSEVQPRAWQREMGIAPRGKDEPKTAHKRRLKAMAQQLFPRATVTLATCDALLIAETCRRMYVGAERKAS